MNGERPQHDTAMPVWGTTFVGRDAEIQHVIAMLRRPDRRLVTLFGPGGVGKTRLACEIAKHMAEYMPVSFITVEFSGDIEGALAGQLPGFIDRRDARIEKLLAFLGSDAQLVVLDNLEHVIDQAPLLEELTSQCPNLRILATSRAVLGLPAEWVVPVRGLQFPNKETSTAAAAFDAVRLVVDRVEQLSGRRVDDAQYPAVVRICSLTDGLPLAIELAASWSGTLSLAEIVSELEEGSTVLTARGRQASERHQSMRAVVEQSWQLLDPAEQSLFARLAVFVDGFSREACVHVAGASLPGIASLVEKSLVQRDEDGRFRLHPLMSEFAREMLGRDPEQARELIDRHARYYLELLRERRANLRGKGQAAAVLELRTEWGNIRRAWNRATERRWPSEVCAALDPLHAYCALAGQHELARELAEQALDITLDDSKISTLLTFRALMMTAWAHQELGHLEKAEEAAVASEALFPGLELDARINIDPAAVLGLIARTRGNFEAARRFGDEAVRRARQAKDLWRESFGLYVSGNACMAEGDFAGAEVPIRRAFALSEKAGDAWFLGFLHNDLGRIALKSGDLDVATAHFSQSLAIRAEMGNVGRMAVAEQRLAEVLEARGEFREAEERQRRSMRFYARAGDRGAVVRSMAALGRLAARREPAERALRRLAEALPPALELGMLPVVLDVLWEIANIEGARKHGSSDALRLLTLIAGDPRARQETRKSAEATILAARYQAHELADARRWAMSTTAEAVATALATSLRGPGDGAIMTGPKHSIEDPGPDLTSREKDVLQLMAVGMSNEQIGDQLGLKVGTVKWYSSQLFEKLGVANRTQATARARELGILD